MKKTEIAESEYNLTGNRYREVIDYSNIKYDFIKIGEVFDSGRGRVISKQYIEKNIGKFPVYSSQTSNNGIFGYINTNDFEGEYLTWTTDGANAGKVFHRTGKFNCTNVCGTLKLKEKFSEIVDLEYIAPILDAITEHYVVRVGNPKLMNKEIERIKIPLPPLEIQKQIVAELDGYQKVIDGAKQVVENWKPNIKIESDWEITKLGEVCKTTSGGTPLKSKNEYYDSGKIPWLRSGEVSQGEVKKSKLFITELGLKESSAKFFPNDTVLVAMYGATAGQVGILKFEASTNQAICGVLPCDDFVPEFLYQVLKSQKERMIQLSGGGAQPNISQTIIKDLKVPIPSLEIQKKIVAEIEAEQEIVNQNKKLIEIFEKKIKTKISEIWGE